MVIQRILRHANVSTTATYYIKTAADDVKHAMQKLENIVTLGYMAYGALLNAYGIRPRQRMREAVQDTLLLLGGSALVPVYHHGNNGSRSRTFEHQKADWQRVRQAVDGKLNCVAYTLLDAPRAFAGTQP
jgi:hypothetical protein